MTYKVRIEFRTTFFLNEGADDSLLFTVDSHDFHGPIRVQIVVEE